MVNHGLNKQWFEQLLVLAEQSSDQGQLGLARLLMYKSLNPEVYVSLTGETSAGKSTLLNSLLNEKLLPVSVKPTTGMVTQLSFHSENSARFEAINQDASLEQIDYPMFVKLHKEPDEDLLRLVYHCPNTKKQGLNLFDTPGYNSLTPGHQEVLESFLSHSDMVLFICNYRVGFNKEDQSLLTKIKAMVDVSDTPIFLIVNRTPSGKTAKDKRIREIKQSADDCLGLNLPILLVYSRNPDDGLPDTEHLWHEIHHFASKPERMAEVQRHLKSLSLELLKEMVLHVEAKLAASLLSQEERQIYIEHLSSLAELDRKIDSEIDRFERRMNSTIPKVIHRSITDQKRSIFNYIDGENKWLNHENCASYIEVHALPQLATRVSHDVRDFLLHEVEKLNQRLEEIVNTTISEIEANIKLKGGNAHAVFNKISQKIAIKLAREVLGGLMLKFGGVGGAAAGAGNLVKMGVKRAGNLFGKRFGREVYTEIGKKFTKKALERAAIVVGVVIELGLYMKEVFTWKKELKARLEEQLIEMEKDLSKSILNEEIPRIATNNKEGALEVIESMRTSYTEVLDSTNNEHDLHLCLQKQLQQLQQLQIDAK